MLACLQRTCRFVACLARGVDQGRFHDSPIAGRFRWCCGSLLARLWTADPVQTGYENRAANDVAERAQAQVVPVAAQGDRLAMRQEEAEQQPAHVGDAVFVAAGDDSE